MRSKLVIKAHNLVRLALNKGKLNIPDCCELCGSPSVRLTSGQLNLCGHHYAGYEGENALKVWFVCWSCNSALKGRHDGSLTQEEARALIQSK
jgi:hypothetical protein